jgi:hypothetical protein
MRVSSTCSASLAASSATSALRASSSVSVGANDARTLSSSPFTAATSSSRASMRSSKVVISTRFALRSRMAWSRSCSASFTLRPYISSMTRELGLRAP